MMHFFEVSLAEKVGVEKAVLVKNIEFWLEKNKANNVHAYDGYYWTYNSSAAFSKLFPYWSAKKIQRMILELENDGFLISGKYNKAGYDQTKWYTTPNFLIGQNCPMDRTNLSNGLVNNVQPIPYINTDSKPDTSTPSSGDSARVDEDKILEAWNTTASEKNYKGARGIPDKIIKSIRTNYSTYLKDAKRKGKEASELSDINTFTCGYIRHGFTGWASDFYSGKNDKNWRADLEFVTRRATFEKIFFSAE